MSRHVDPEILSGFVDEVIGYLPAIRAGLDQLRTDPASAEECHRHVHTIKGAAAMVGLTDLSHLAYHLEDLIDDIMLGKLLPTPATFVALEQGFAGLETYIGAMVDQTEVSESLVGETVRAIQAGRTAATVNPHPPATPDDTEDAIGGDFPSPDDGDTHTDLASELTGLLPPFPLGLKLADEPPPAFDLAPPAFDLAPPAFDVSPPPSYDPAPSAAISESVSENVSEAVPEAESVPNAEDISAELLEVFRLEADDHLRTLTTVLPLTKNDPTNKDHWQDIRRAAHTLKGTAAMVGFADVTKLAHRMEDLLDQYFDGTRVATADEIGLLLNATDAIEDVVNGRSVSFETLYPKFDAVLAVGTVAAVEAEHPTPELAPAVADPIEDDAEAEKVDTRRRDVNEQFVRVPIEKLNDIVKLVSELVIARTAFETRMGDFQRLLGELSPSTGRLRRASTKLETGYEAVALAGNRGGAGGGGFENFSGGDGFDDLELDRYTEFHLISRELAETTNDIQTLGSEIGYVHSDFDGFLTRQARLSSELEDKLMRLRMVPLATVASKLHRTVRNAAQSTNKQAELVFEGDRTGLDKTVLEAMNDPLLHLLRNAVDHGLETPEVRRALNKPATGRIHLTAGHEGSQVVLRIADDGKGIDVEVVRSTAVARGVLSQQAADAMAVEDVYALLFLPGFSTKATVSELSGRGVGLDVVKSKVEALKGTVTVTSVAGRGTTFTIRLPMTLAVTRALMVRSQNQTFAVPLDAVEQIVRFDEADVQRIGTEPVLRVNGHVYPVAYLSRTLNLKGTPDESVKRPPVVLLRSADRRVAVVVEHLLGGREIVIKNLGSHLKRVPCVSGATLTGDGTVVLILNPADLVRAAAVTAAATTAAPIRSVPVPPRSRGKTVMLVDDSPSVRRVLTNLIERQGWTPVTAKDGIEALEVLQRGSLPDLILSDIEMPRMDGYELLGSVRGQPALAHLPVVMITSRAADKHRKKAMDLGASAYVTKPYQDESLVAIIRQLTPLRAE